MDRSPEVLALARRRADADHVRHVTFIENDLMDLELENSFDALIGRFVLMYLPDPSAVLNKLTQFVRESGLIAFQEMDISSNRSRPDMPVWQQCNEWIKNTFQRAHVDIEMGTKLYGTFRRAGLPGPRMNLHARIGGGPDLPAYEYIADIVSSLLPMMERFGAANAAEVQIDTLARRLRDETTSTEGVLTSPSLVGAWTQKFG